MFSFPAPELQIAFSGALADARREFLQDALGRTAEAMDIAVLDQELVRCSPRQTLSALARNGLRGELLFATPALIRANPRLIGYYRLLLGYSQKEFFTAATGASMYKSAEVRGKLNAAAGTHLEAFCLALNVAADSLAMGVGHKKLTRELLDDLSLLTLGPQLRGGANNLRGSLAIDKVFAIVHSIVKPAITSSDGRQIRMTNAAKRDVVIEFAADPDLVVREHMAGNSLRNVVAIEIKGGADYSNIHNRIGEAEKSHRKARAEGYTECWTIVNVPGLDMTMARKESPTTDRFYVLDALADQSSEAYKDFFNRVVALTGIRLRNKPSRQNQT